MSGVTWIDAQSVFLINPSFVSELLTLGPQHQWLESEFIFECIYYTTVSLLRDSLGWYLQLKSGSMLSPASRLLMVIW